MQFHPFIACCFCLIRVSVIKCFPFRLVLMVQQQVEAERQTLEQSAQEYTPENVCQFLEEINLGQHVAAFSGEEINGEMLLEAEDEMLQELGVNSPIERLKIRVCVWGGEKEEERKGVGGQRGERQEGEPRRYLISCLFQVLFRQRLQGGVVQYPLQTVLNFLEQNKLSKYLAIFRESGMDGDLLLEADDSVLEELGVTSAIERLEIKVQ